MTPAILPRVAAAAHSGLSISTMEKLVRQGRFPKPRQLSPGRVGWLPHEINEWAQALPVSELLPGPGL